MKHLMIATAIALMALGGGAVAQEDAGKQEYMIACAGCHGESGMGDGPFAAVLNVDTPSLTTLAAQNGGEFPFLQTLMVIDGRTGVRGHDGGLMPIWGDRYLTTATELAGVYGAETIVRGRLLSLVYYLETIQN